jgi:homoserine dehydrogenase
MMGLGNVGSQVADRLLSKREALRQRTGIDIDLRAILVRDRAKPRPIEPPSALLTTDPDALLADPEIQLIVEVIGGDEPARSYLEAALRAGKHVVTANKVVMARHGPALLRLAAHQNLDLYFEAAVGGGIPLISTFKIDLQANEINRIAAVINGTTNYVLGRMSAAGLAFDAAVREAQQAGYAEADPTDDVDGFDAVYKLAVMSSIAFGTEVPPESVYREGIRDVRPVDFRYARELGYEIKLLAYTARVDTRLDVRVHPAMVPLTHPLAQVEGAFNAVFIEGDLIGPVLLYGQGAGGRPTASAVIGDVVDVGRSIQRGVQRRTVHEIDAALALLPIDDVTTRAYFRVQLADKPGVLAAVSAAFGEEGVSISSAIQKEAFADRGAAEFVVTTHPATDAALRRTRERLARLPVVDAVGTFLRVL